MKLTRELKTGIITLGGIVLFIMGFSYLKASSLFDNEITLHAVYDDIAGLQTGTSVSMKGTNIGKVNGIKFINGNRQVLVSFSISNKVEFSKNSVAELFGSSPLGGMALSVEQVYDDAPMAKENDTLPTRKKAGLVERLDPLQKNIDGAINNVGSMFANVNSLLSEDKKMELKDGITKFSQLMVSLNQSATRLNAMLANNQTKLDSSIENINEITSNFAAVSKTLKDSNLSETIQNFGTSVENLNILLAKIERGEGSLGKLANDEELYNNLTNASRELDLLLQDFRLNPKRYVNVSVFGKKQKDYTLPENDPAEQQNQ